MCNGICGRGGLGGGGVVVNRECGRVVEMSVRRERKFRVSRERRYSVIESLEGWWRWVFVRQWRRKHQDIGPMNMPKQLINYSYFILCVSRPTPEHMTINKQRQDNHLLYASSCE